MLIAGHLCVTCSLGLSVFCSTLGAQETLVPLPIDVYLDKCRGAWAGQMIGVAYGAPYEFEYNGRIQEDPIRPWRPEYIANGLSQDDLYVEMVWLSALQKHGLDITYEQAGKAFAASTCGLAHANNLGRENVRHGIMPPTSGHPKHNRHADDIDFQIESDIFGIICPGLPQEASCLCSIFGHIMNYGDGVYGGMFVAGMYSAAYFENKDVEKVVRTGLACIPRESQYYKCISDVITWIQQNPGDWRATWHLIEKKWQDDIDCVPGNAFNIDAKINGAYIVMGLLYGGGDVARTLEVSTRCGQDNDCNPSNATGVLGCMMGFRNIPEQYTAGLSAIKGKTFPESDRTFDDVVNACRSLSEKMVSRVGGKVDSDTWRIPVQQAKPAKLEQWDNQMEILSIAVPQVEVDRWDARWRLISCGYELGPGYKPEFAGRKHVLLLVPKRDRPAIMEAELEVPDTDSPRMRIPISSFGTDGNWIGNFRLKVLFDKKPQLDKMICTFGRFTMEELDVSHSRGQRIRVRIEVHREGDYHWERAYFGRIEFE